MTIAFLSLFFGLIRGPFPVELAVNGPAAAVELLVDGRSVQKLQAPPWQAEVDFGPDLLPHQIVARALDAKGRETARAEEWVNLPHPQTKVDIVLDESRPVPKAAKVQWTDVKEERTRATQLTFDGSRLPLDAAGRAALPPHDLKALHLLTAEVDLASGRSARKEIAYGGEYGSEVSTELTAVPVRTERHKLPPAGELGGWLTAAGKPLPVVAVEEGPAQLYVVRSLVAVDALLDLSPGSKGWVRRDAASTASRWEGMKLGREDDVRIVVPFTHVYQGSEKLSDLFEILAGLNAWDHGLPVVLLMTGRRPQPGPGIRIRFTDAVAVAGLEATTENRRRAVLLLLSAKERDQSRYDPALVRRYLDALHVPLFVWCVGDPEPGSAAAAWGKVEVLKYEADLKRAFAALRESLDSQRILMVDGRHLPQSVALSPQATGVELVGAHP